MNNKYCVILAGGIGSRLWPSSRQGRPKQFLDVLGTGETLLQTTYRRFAQFMPVENIVVVSNEQYRDIVTSQLPHLDPANLLLEPMRRNTVPSVTWAALEIRMRCENAVIVVSPSDQLILDEKRFEDDIRTGLDYAANNDRLLTLGVQPQSPETAFGYIQMAQSVGPDIYKVQSFTEKPEEQFAQMFVDSNEFLWNIGLFIWSVSTFITALHGKHTDFANMMEVINERFKEGVGINDCLDEMFSIAPNMPLEQGVLEKADNVDVMLCHFKWSDLGSWSAVYDALPKQDGTNVVIDSKSLLYDCKECIIKLPDGHVAVIQGLKDYMVVEEGNVLVVCKKSDQKSIRKFMNDAQLNLGSEFV